MIDMTQRYNVSAQHQFHQPRRSDSAVLEQIRLDEDLAHKLSIQEMQHSGSLNAGSSTSSIANDHPPRPHGDLGRNQASSPNSTNWSEGIAYIDELAGSSARLRRRSSTQSSVSEPAPVLIEPTPQHHHHSVHDRSPDLEQARPITHQRTNSLEIPSSGLTRIPTPVASRDFCRRCKSDQDAVSFCPACSINYCPAHWDEQPLHEESQQEPNQRPLHGVPHEKTDPRVAKAIISIVEPATTLAEHVKQHQNDDSTTWFGVQTDHSNELNFHDWGRYEEFLTQSRFSNKACQFPSLITFAGPTGAGKSTIVKALVQLFRQSDREEPQTPVVGLVETQTVPTSGEVHLYWDSWTLRGPRPLLFADCEGLGGGSRQPYAERAVSGKDKKTLTKEKKDKHRQARTSADYGFHDPSAAAKQLRSSMFGRATPPFRASPGPASPPISYLGSSSYGNTQYFDHSATLPANSYSPYSPIEPPEEEDWGWASGSVKSQSGYTRQIAWAHGPMRQRQFIVENLYPRLLYTFSDVVVLVIRNAK